MVADAGANIDAVHHRRAVTVLAVQNVEIERVIQTRDRSHIRQVVSVLDAACLEASQQR